MIPTVGLLTHNNYESNLIVLSQDNKIPGSDLLKDLYRFLVIQSFKIIKSLQKMFNTYRHNTEVTKYKKNKKHCIPGLPNKAKLHFPIGIPTELRFYRKLRKIFSENVFRTGTFVGLDRQSHFKM